MSGTILPASLAFHLAEKPRLIAAYTAVALIFHNAGLDVWHRPDGAPHPARFSFGRKPLSPAAAEDLSHAIAWINPGQGRLVISAGQPDDAGQFHFRRQFPAQEFPRQPDSQNIKIAIEMGTPPESLEALNQRLTQALATMPADSCFAPRPGHGCFWPDDYASAAKAAA